MSDQCVRIPYTALRNKLIQFNFDYFLCYVGSEYNVESYLLLDDRNDGMIGVIIQYLNNKFDKLA